LEPGADVRPRRRRIQRETGVRIADGQEEAGAEPLPEPRGHDETTLVVKAMLGRTGEERTIRHTDLHSGSNLLHLAPLYATLPTAHNQQATLSCSFTAS